MFKLSKNLGTNEKTEKVLRSSSNSATSNRNVNKGENQLWKTASIEDSDSLRNTEKQV